MEAKRIGVGGGLDYDSQPFLINEGDGRERADISINDNGYVEPILDFSRQGGFVDIQFIVEDANVFYICDKSGSKYFLYKFDGILHGGTFFPEIFSTSEDLIINRDEATVTASDGKILIVEPERDPIYIDVNHYVDLSLLNAYEANMVDNGTHIIFRLPTEPSLNAGDYVTFFSTPELINKEFFPRLGGKAKVLNVTSTFNILGAGYWTVKLDLLSKYKGADYIDSRIDVYFSEVNEIPLISPYLYLNRPIPQRAPKVYMEADTFYHGNNFIDTVFSFGYSFVYVDGYETPVSPMSEIDLTSQRQKLLGLNLNKAVLSVRPYNGVSKVKFYCKRNNESNDLELIAEKEAFAITTCEYYGDSGIDVLDNTEYLKSSQAIPLSPIVGKFLDNRVVLGAKTKAYDNGEVKFIGTNYTTWEKVIGTTFEAYAEPSKGVYSPNIVRFKFTPPSEINFSPDTTVGYYSLSIAQFSYFEHGGEPACYYVLKGTGSVFYSNESKQTVGDRLAQEISKNLEINFEKAGGAWSKYSYQSHTIYSDSTGSIIVDIIIPTMDEYPYTVGGRGVNQFSNREGGISFDKSLKLDERYQLGVQFFDESGRTGGVVTSDTSIDYETLSYSLDSVQIIKPRCYLNNPPSWAKYYQFAVAKRVNTNSHHFIPCKNTAGSWGTTSNAYIKEANYTLLALNLMTIKREEAVSGLAYSYKAGDYLKYVRRYDTNGQFRTIESENELAAWGKVVGVELRNDIEYVIVDGLPSLQSDFDTGAYMQFEVKNFTESKTTGAWQLIGDRYLVKEISYRYYHPVRGGYRHDIDWGDYFVRPVQGLFFETDVDTSLYVESKYLNDSSFNKQCFSANRIGVEQPKIAGDVFYLCASRPYIDGTNSNGYCVFDYDNASYLTDTYGAMFGFEKVGNRLVVFFERALYVMNVNTIEVQSDSSSDAIYVSSYFGNGKFFEKYGMNTYRLSCTDGSRVYYYDTERNTINLISDNGIYDICGVEQHANGLSNKFMSSEFKTKPKAIFFDKKEKRVYVSFDNYVYVYDTRFDRWILKRNISFDFVVHGYAKMYNSGSILLVPGSNYNALIGETGVINTGVYDVFVPFGEDVDFLSLVCYSDFKPEVDVNVYGQNGLMFKTKIRKAAWTKINDGYYCDIPKGCLAGETLRTYHLYEGYDMVGKSIQLKFYIEGKFYGVEVRYEKRNY